MMAPEEYLMLLSNYIEKISCSVSHWAEFLTYLNYLFIFKQDAEEAAEADEVTEPPFSKGTLHVGKSYVISITVLQAQGIPVQYTDIFCQIR